MLVGSHLRICMSFLGPGLYAAPALAGRRCAALKENAATFHGYEDIVISIAHSMRSPRGVVKAPDGSTLRGALVEVFDQP
jgi:hypothetical protein